MFTIYRATAFTKQKEYVKTGALSSTPEGAVNSLAKTLNQYKANLTVVVEATEWGQKGDLEGEGRVRHRVELVLP